LVDVITCDFLAPPPGGANPNAPWIRGLIHDGVADSAPVLALDPNGVLSAYVQTTPGLDLAEAVE
jgi:hypothetical protein